MPSSAQYVGTPQVWAGSMSTANTARDGSGTTTTLVTGAATPGTRLDKIRFVGVGTVTGGMVRVFLNNGTTKFLLREVAVPATTPSATVEGWAYDLTFGDGLVLPS